MQRKGCLSVVWITGNSFPVFIMLKVSVEQGHFLLLRHESVGVRLESYVKFNSRLCAINCHNNTNYIFLYNNGVSIT